jgi:hypothetical protein
VEFAHGGSPREPHRPLCTCVFELAGVEAVTRPSGPWSAMIQVKALIVVHRIFESKVFRVAVLYKRISCRKLFRPAR